MAMNWVVLFAVCFTGISSTVLPYQGDSSASWEPYGLLHPRQRRDSLHVINDCTTVTSQEGRFVFKSLADDALLGFPCGIYFFTDADRQVEIEILHVDVSCEDDGSVTFVDGWELSGEYFPSIEDHELPMEERVVSVCGNRQLKNKFLSSQNAALIQFRVPAQEQGFSLRVHYVTNPKPCNILVEGASDVYTLSNYGRAINCSVTTIYPASVAVMNMNIGSASSRFLHSAHTETGLIHKCDKQGSSDYLQIGGSSGLDTSKMSVADSICGTTNNLKRIEETIDCFITTVRLVSSGRSTNYATVAVRPATNNDRFSASFVCTA